jgi:ABC-type sugar transport system ATPase subunit
MATLTIDNLSKSYGSVAILKDINLAVSDGEFVVLVGPSGCGKSTLLRCIAGLEAIDSGDLFIGQRRVNDLPPAERKIAMVFQSYALYPHRNVHDNMTFGLRFSGMDKAEMERRVAAAAQMLQLEPLLGRKPRDLSGGQRQRVAIGRAIVREPSIFLFDEPLSNLDAALRVSTRIEIAKLHRMLSATMVYVTHDQTEAMTLADRIVVMNGGRIEQAGAPLDLYYRPANLFVARFIGSPAMNLFEASSAAGALKAAGIGTIDLGATPLPEGRLTIGVRPEHFRLAATGDLVIEAGVDLVERLGEISYAHLRSQAGTPLIVELRGRTVPAPGQTITISADRRDLHVFDSSGASIALALA